MFLCIPCIVFHQLCILIKKRQHVGETLMSYQKINIYWIFGKKNIFIYIRQFSFEHTQMIAEFLCLYLNIHYIEPVKRSQIHSQKKL